MRATLTTTLPLKRFAVFAEMAWLDKRPELGLLCRGAVEQEDSRITPAFIQSILPGTGEVGAKNILNWCKLLKLCDGGGTLRDLGRQVAETDDAPVPEQGVYGLWVTEHPLLGRAILKAERLTSERDPHLNQLVPLPINPDRGVPFTSALDPKEHFILRDLPSHQGEPLAAVETTRGICTLRWDLDFNRGRDQWQLRGELEDPEGKLQPINHSTHEAGLDLWGLMERWGHEVLNTLGTWDPSERRLLVPSKKLPEAARDTFQIKLQITNATVPGKGTYQNVSLEQVPIGPLTPKDGNHWAGERLARSLKAAPLYRTRGMLRELFADLVEDTPLEASSPTLMAHDALMKAGPKGLSPEIFWSLAAPVDLAPTPLPSEALKAFTVAAPGRTDTDIHSASSVPPREGASQIRIPYRGGWSMVQLMEAILQGQPASRLLLCDRFVRGERNMETLHTFAEALRDLSPRGTLGVWTEDANLRRIMRISRGSVSDYSAQFGRERPHDRYILVEREDGERIAWQLSNSPLDARADVPSPGARTPLRWRDFVASQVDIQGLLPALKSWFKGDV